LDQRRLIPEKMSSHLKEENVEVLSK
jgi:hypothetical protein